MTLLQVERISKSFGGVHAARDVSFEVAAGEMVAMIGPNGAGKSTTFNMVGGQLRPDTGGIRLGGVEISGLPPRLVLRHGVGRTFQIAQAFLSMTVIENVQMAILAKRGEVFGLWRPARDCHRDEAEALLKQVRMEDQAERLVAHLAYADIKRVEFALALAAEPKLLLMDEPTAGMAVAERQGLMKLVESVATEKKIGVLFTEHDMASVFAHADKVLVLARGEIIARGMPEEVRANERVREVYLGRSGHRQSAPVKALAS
ncbi:ABC transporter ATP-binding protein [Terrarubrum flagellatum]|uniref:ABC transporter ATP-binding protein n=1 Tax=Terrirubrum flagellatum TaxID=2895980 RepID=UPI00314521FD